MDGKAAEPLTTLEDELELVSSPEEQRVTLWRFTESRRLGLSHVEARLFAESGSDLGLLRNLVASGCQPSLALRIAL